MIDFDNIDISKPEGFSGFLPIKTLVINMGSVPQKKGVYLVLRSSKNEPTFLETGTGGFFKGKDPNVSIDELKRNWVENAKILYIGQAGGKGKKATLNSRLKQYLKFGEGKNIGHYGGRYIWQLLNSQDLVICWKSLLHEDPREVEASLIDLFKFQHGDKRPFANLKD